MASASPTSKQPTGSATSLGGSSPSWPTPTSILTHAYEGGHPDHDAVAFAVAAAVRVAGRAADTTIVEMPFYRAGPEGWIRQLFLPHDGASD